jgi:hypothetical protein
MEGIYLQRLAKDALGLSEALGTEQGLAVALARGEQPGPRGGGGRNVQVGWVSEKVGKNMGKHGEKYQKPAIFQWF